MTVHHQDSVGKVVSYLHAVALEPLTYKGKHLLPYRKFYLSTKFFRNFTCPPMCGGCCPRFSLDYFPGPRCDEARTRYRRLQPRKVTINERTVTVYSDLQDDHADHSCRNLDKSNGRCGIHTHNPFSCSFELIRVLHFRDEGKAILTKKLFGRGWNLLRIDGERGAKCEMTPFDIEVLYGTDVPLLQELCAIADLFDIRTRLPDILTFLERHRPQFERGLLPAVDLIPF